MTLNEFLSATSEVPEPILRYAMTAALSVEPARTPDACRRFYSRTVHELGLAADDATCVAGDARASMTTATLAGPRE